MVTEPTDQHRRPRVLVDLTESERAEGRTGADRIHQHVGDLSRCRHRPSLARSQVLAAVDVLGADHARRRRHAARGRRGAADLPRLLLGELVRIRGGRRPGSGRPAARPGRRDPAGIGGRNHLRSTGAVRSPVGGVADPAASLRGAAVRRSAARGSRSTCNSPTTGSATPSGTPTSCPRSGSSSPTSQGRSASRSPRHRRRRRDSGSAASSTCSPSASCASTSWSRCRDCPRQSRSWSARTAAPTSTCSSSGRSTRSALRLRQPHHPAVCAATTAVALLALRVGSHYAVPLGLRGPASPT